MLRSLAIWLLACLALFVAPAAATDGTDQAGAFSADSDVESDGTTQEAILPDQADKKGVAADKAPTKSASSATSPAANAAKPRITPELENAVIDFVAQHHPQLEDLLMHLKEGVPQEYERALRDLWRTRERLALIKERDEERYTLELKIWQTQSRAQLLAARLQMADDAKLRAELKQTLADEYALRLELLRRDQVKAEERLRKLNEQLAKAERERESALEKQYQSLTQPLASSTAGSGKAKANSKPAPAKKPTKSSIKSPPGRT